MTSKTTHVPPSLQVQPAAPVAGLRRRERPAYEHDQFYRGREWRQFRERIMEERGYTCAGLDAYGCPDGYVGGPRQGDVVLDHIKTIREAPHLKLEPTNVRILCKRNCDMRRHAKDRPGSRKR